MERSLIHAGVTKAPGHLTRSGCAYALRLRGKLEEAVRIMRKNEIVFGKIFATEDGREYREVSL